MLLSDSIFLLRWYGLILLLGSLFVPITAWLFPRFYDKGYIFSKVIGIIAISYTMFVVGTLHLLPFTIASCYFLIVLLAIGNFLLFRKKISLFFPFMKNIWKIALFEELVFILAMWFWTFVRGHQPNINGLEKFMDFGFVNSILRGTYFPPKDMWLPPFSINYYYFGHLTTAVLTRAAMIPSYITFNLMLGTLFAFCLVCSFSLGLNLLYQFAVVYMPSFRLRVWGRIIVGAVLIAYLTTLGGNLHLLYGFFKPYVNEQPVPLWQLPFMPWSFPNNYWYPNATRFIYHTIHEFPLYSFVVSDLHGHVLDIPFVLLILAVFYSQLLQVTRVKRKASSVKYFSLPFTFHAGSFSNLLIISFLLSVMYMTNAWDGLIYFLFAFFVVSYIRIQRKNYDDTFQLLGMIGFDLLVIGIGSFIFTQPFSRYFEPLKIASGIGIVCPPDFLIKIGKIGPFVFETDHCMRSPLWQLGILWGFFYFWVTSLIVFFFIKQNKKDPLFAPSDIFVLMLITVGTLLIIAPEFVYLKDIYATYFRANTMFKLVYQSFIMLSIASGYSVIRFMSQTSIKEKFFLIPYIVVGSFFLVVVSMYPYFATSSYYDNLKTYQGLNGTKYLETSYSTDAKAITWINDHITGQPVILEAQGDSYTDYARISANTGLPTVLGWPVHEWLWRGTYDVASPRIADIQTMYETTDVTLTKELLQKYHVQYIFVGNLEQKKYKLSEEKFRSLGDIIYQNGTTIIYRLRV